ncbi:hypothetical protein ACFY41_07250 [Streptomyces syringium]|uniref:hypothetical protein n=1 Tax=Streptomyces syringium TaxID=76729 RepID=UPI0036832141
MKFQRARAAAASGFALVALVGMGISGCSGDPAGQGSASGSSGPPAADKATRADDSRDALKDVEISACTYVDKKGISASLMVFNHDVTATYSYEVAVKFTAPDGTPVATKTTSVSFIRPGRWNNLDIVAPYTPKAGASTSGVKCAVDKVERSAG